jgi:hypothetical protein
MMAVITTGKTNLALPYACPGPVALRYWATIKRQLYRSSLSGVEEAIGIFAKARLLVQTAPCVHAIAVPSGRLKTFHGFFVSLLCVRRLAGGLQWPP